MTKQSQTKGKGGVTPLFFTLTLALSLQGEEFYRIKIFTF